jgi:hypothetical protein
MRLDWITSATNDYLVLQEEAFTIPARAGGGGLSPSMGAGPEAGGAAAGVRGMSGGGGFLSSLGDASAPTHTHHPSTPGPINSASNLPMPSEFSHMAAAVPGDFSNMAAHMSANMAANMSAHVPSSLAGEYSSMPAVAGSGLYQSIVPSPQVGVV